MTTEYPSTPPTAGAPRVPSPPGATVSRSGTRPSGSRPPGAQRRPEPSAVNSRTKAISSGLVVLGAAGVFGAIVGAELGGTSTVSLTSTNSEAVSGATTPTTAQSPTTQAVTPQTPPTTVPIENVQPRREVVVIPSTTVPTGNSYGSRSSNSGTSNNSSNSNSSNNNSASSGSSQYVAPVSPPRMQTRGTG